MFISITNTSKQEYNPVFDSVETHEFLNYVLEYYGKNGLYDYNFTDVEVEDAFEHRISNIETPYDGDSHDRELIRDIVFARRGEYNKIEHLSIKEIDKALL